MAKNVIIAVLTRALLLVRTLGMINRPFNSSLGGVNPKYELL